MPFLVLAFNALAVRKLAARGLAPRDVKAIFLHAPVVTVPNPNPRAMESLFAIGPTPDGRFVTVVVDPDPEGHHVAMPDPHDHAPDAFDALLDADHAKTVGPFDAVRTVLAVELPSDAIEGLTARASREGRDVETLVAEVLRAAAA